MTYKIIAQVIKISKTYTTGDAMITSLERFIFDLNFGGLTLIISPLASGKTTLLSLFGYVIYPCFGEVFIDGVKINDLSKYKLLIGLMCNK